MKRFLTIVLALTMAGELLAVGQPTAAAQGKAVKELRVTRATEARIRRELEALKRQPDADPELIRDYEIYLDRIQRLLAARQKQAGDVPAPPPLIPQAPTIKGFTPEVKKPENKVKNLDRELDAVLAEFDEYLLKQVPEVEDAAADTQSGGGGGGAESLDDLEAQAEAAARRLKERGIDVGESAEGQSAEAGESSQAGEQTQAGEAGGERELETLGGPEDNGQQTTGTREGGNAQTGRDPKTGAPMPTKRGGRGYSGPADDDIVARQLREAAEKETDPELRKKLWKEYYDYKGIKPPPGNQ
jgi:hypothetical protein